MTKRALFSFLVALPLVACASPEASEPAPQQNEGVDQADLAASEDELATSTFYRVESPDFRKCAFPMCGGAFISRVNRSTTRCADGVYRDRCYVAELDMSLAGFTGAQASDMASQLEYGGGVFRARYSTKAYGKSYPVLRITEAWVPMTTAPASGTFYRVSPSGITCITTPCPVVAEAKLNYSTKLNIDGVDLAALGATEAQVEAAWQALQQGNLLVAGTNIDDAATGPQSTGNVLYGTQAYLRAEPISGYCSADSDCTTSIYRQSVDGPSDCYCTTCPAAVAVSDVASFEADFSKWCAPQPSTCPQVKCRYMVSHCVANRCELAEPTP